jgi:hypothetical protein
MDRNHNGKYVRSPKILIPTHKSTRSHNPQNTLDKNQNVNVLLKA